MNEELYSTDNNTDTSDNNTDNVDLLAESEEVEEEVIADDETQPEAMASVGEVVPFDYSYIDTTNQYLFVIVVLLVVFVVTYCFNFLRHSFERLGF